MKVQIGNRMAIVAGHAATLGSNDAGVEEPFHSALATISSTIITPNHIRSEQSRQMTPHTNQKEKT